MRSRWSPYKPRVTLMQQLTGVRRHFLGCFLSLLPNFSFLRGQTICCPSLALVGITIFDL